MVHGDDNGLVLPPYVAPTQVVIIPIKQEEEGVLDKAYELEATLKKQGIRVTVDSSDNRPGWKFSEAEMRGIPVRIEIGPKDIENNQCIIAKRNTGEKITASITNIVDDINNTLEVIHNEMYDKALKHLNDNIRKVSNYDEFKNVLTDKGGFILADWCGDENCENKIKEETSATTRCIKGDSQGKCIYCQKDAKYEVYFAKSY